MLSKVLFVCPTSGNGGIQSWGKKVLESFPKDEYQLCHVNVSQRRSTLHHEMGMQRKIDGVIDLCKAYIDVRKAIRKNRFSLMHTTTSGNIGTLRDYILCRLCHRHNIPCIMHCHYGCVSKDFIAKGFWGNLLRKTMRMYDQIWVLDRHSEAALKSDPLLADKVFVTPNSIEVSDTCDLTPKDYTKIAFVGNLNPQKGILELVHAIADYDLNVILTIIGPSSEQTLREIQRISAEKYGSQIVYLGQLQNTEAVAELKSMDMIALPSYFTSEAFPISILEAMSLGKMVIATRRAAIPDMLTDVDGNPCGCFVRERSIEDIVDAIRWCQDNATEADRMCAKAYEKVKTCYKTDVVFALYRKLYNKMVNCK